MSTPTYTTSPESFDEFSYQYGSHDQKSPSPEHHYLHRYQQDNEWDSDPYANAYSRSDYYASSSYSGLDTGTPAFGKYAQDGLWDDESDTTTVRRAGSTSTSHTVVTRSPASGLKSSKSSVKKVNMAAVASSSSAFAAALEDEKPVWTKTRKASTPGPSIMEGEKEHKLDKKKSMGRLMGIGRKVEIATPPVDLGDESFEAGPLPPAPSSSTKYRKSTYPLAPVQINQPVGSATEFGGLVSPVVDTPTTDLKGKQSVWKRSMNKLFKSKSTTGLRESYRADSNVQPPPMPSLPSNVSSLTAPLNVKKRDTTQSKSKHLPTPPPSATRSEFTPQYATSKTNTRSVYSTFMTSPPPTASSTCFSQTSHPTLPSDPFASSFDSASNTLPSSTSQSHFDDHPAPPTRPKLPRHSPSLKDLKSFLPSRRIAKTKSLANLRVDKDKENSPVPDLPIKESLPSQSSINADLETPSYPLASPAVESPPLLPPKPSYFPTSAGSSRPISASTSTSSLTPPPTSPLPPTPSSTGSTPLSGPTHTIPLASESDSSSIPRSNSGAVLLPRSNSGAVILPRSNSGAVILPRSRSTSMSLRAPPTSSSFFDLYEQLGIWPTPEKDDSEPTKAVERPEPTSPLEGKTALTSSLSNLSNTFEPEDQSSLKGTVSESPSGTFSTSSWQAAIDAFPIVDSARSSEAVADMSMDFGLPYVNESSVMALENEQMTDHIGDVSLTPEDAIDGENGRSRATKNSSPSTSGQVHRASSQRQTGPSSTGYSSRQNPSRRSSDSRSSSRDSRRRSHNHVEGQWYENGESSGSENSEDDDVPLSTLHPQAQAKREAAAERKEQKLAARARRADKAKVGPVASKRNPGEQWNGEGGAPADILSAKLSALLKPKSKSMSHISPSMGNAAAGPSYDRHRPPPIDTRSVTPQRASTRPFEDEVRVSSTMQRSQTTRAGPTHERTSYGHGQGASPRPPVGGLMPSPVFPNEGFASASGYAPQYVVPSGYPVGLLPSPSLPTAAQFSSRGYHVSPVPSPTDYYPSHNGKPYIPYGAQVPPPASSSQSMSRRTTVASRDPSDSSRRSRAGASTEVSRSSSGQHPESQSLSRAPTTSRSSDSRRQEREPSKTYVLRVEGSAKRIEVQVSASTIAKDVLSRSRIELESPGRDRAWVLCEAFGEGGCERELREYEVIETVVKAWDPRSTANALVLRTNHSHNATMVSAIPAKAPFAGSWVEWKNEKDKYVRMWMETRGGQVCLAKNEKTKDEQFINLSLYDVYRVTGQDGPPHGTGFVLRRSDPARTFRNADEFMMKFTADSSTAYKMTSAIYSAKSFLIAQNHPELLARFGTSQVHSSAAVSRRPSQPIKPLVDLHAAPKAKETGFTGKGLLSMI